MMDSRQVSNFPSTPNSTAVSEKGFKFKKKKRKEEKKKESRGEKRKARRPARRLLNIPYESCGWFVPRCVRGMGRNGQI